METRNPVVAGQFYPGVIKSCTAEIEECLRQRSLPTVLPDEIVGGIVPHAGWTFSGSLAAMVFSAIKQKHPTVHTFIIFGAAHSYFGPPPAVCDNFFWRTPLGKASVDRELSDWLLHKKLVVSNSSAHKSEHSIEVQVPFIQHLFPAAEILPILVPPSEHAISLGEAIGEIITPAGKNIVCIGSTDLTHYGPNYGFEPMGSGPDAFRWATETNDRKFIDFALNLEPENMLESASANYNACGAGAAVATVAAAKKLGKTKGVLLGHTNSNEIMLQEMGTQSSDSVGYAAIAF